MKIRETVPGIMECPGSELQVDVDRLWDVMNSEGYLDAECFPKPVSEEEKLQFAANAAVSFLAVRYPGWSDVTIRGALCGKCNSVHVYFTEPWEDN